MKKIIHVSGQFQLQKEKKLSLFFCRFEENQNGVSINEVIDSLIDEEVETKEELNNKLSLLGYGVGASARNIKYQLHEVMEYDVDDAFPQITPESFVGGMLPRGIEHIEYDVNMSVLDGRAIDIK